MSNLGTYSIIPSYIMYDRGVKPQAKLLYGTISSLSNYKGYCYATNGYLADLYGVTIRSIQLYISELENRGYIEVEVIRKDNQQVEERRLWLTEIKRSLEAYNQKQVDQINKIDLINETDNQPYISWMNRE